VARDSIEAVETHAAAAQTIPLITEDLTTAPLLGDRTLLDQLAANLIGNAVRHNVPDGWITVRTGTVTAPPSYASPTAVRSSRPRPRNRCSSPFTGSDQNERVRARAWACPSSPRSPRLTGASSPPNPSSPVALR
jgi:light-regulated signal transduction histidine kinase (bacteriophytochrome)